MDRATFVERTATAGYDDGSELGAVQPVRVRLLVHPVPQDVADARRRCVRKDARAKGHTASATTLRLAAWTILITNVPTSQLRVTEALVVARVRWQMEWLFTLWKSHGQIDQWRTGKPERVVCEVYAQWLAMVLQHGMLLIGCWAYADRRLVKAAQVIRDHAPDVACAQAHPERRAEVLTTIQRVLTRSARMTTRAKQPNTYQILLALTTQDKMA